MPHSRGAVQSAVARLGWRMQSLTTFCAESWTKLVNSNSKPRMRIVNGTLAPFYRHIHQLTLVVRGKAARRVSQVNRKSRPNGNSAAFC